ncbi:MAG: YcaO-like family protein [Nitrospirae bacterium]|nr:YcaO-like family protein [Nitrospirota bacterium]
MVYKIGLIRGIVFDLLTIIPDKELTFEEIFEYLRSRPNDKFMHKHLIERLGQLDEEDIGELIESAKKINDFSLLASLYETCISYAEFYNLRRKFDDIDIEILVRHTPLIYIRWSLDKNLKSRLFWMDLFARNKYHHMDLSAFKSTEFPIPFKKKSLLENKTVHIKDVYIKSDDKSFDTGTSIRIVEPHKTIKRILENPVVKDLLIQDEIRVEWSVSPYAFIRRWKVNLDVSVGRNKWMLKGILREYGKGLTEEEARSSCLMEIIERYSAFANFHDNQSIGYKKEYDIIKARYSKLRDKGRSVLNPNKMGLEVPYEDQEIYWIIAEEINNTGSCEIYIPAQFAFLFSSGNFDEIDLYTQGTTSNGLASGNTMEEAKLCALLEYIERDSEKVSLFSADRYFSLEADNPIINNILNNWKEKGVYIYFLDLTQEIGIPCYKAFFIHARGGFSRGWGAHLDGKIAINRAICELTSPYFLSNNYLTKPLSEEVQRTLKYEDLPDYSSGNVNYDLQILEKLLLMNGLNPIYVDLTKKGLEIPAVRAIIPGMEMLPDLDRYSNFNIRQFRNYLRIMNADLQNAIYS